MTTIEKQISCICGKVYKHASGLSRHKSKCVKVLQRQKVPEDIESRLASIENKLSIILSLLTKDTHIIEDVVEEVVEEVKKIKPVIIEPVIEVITPKLSVIEQKVLLLEGNTEINQEMIDKSTKQLESVTKQKDVHTYIRELPIYNLTLLPVENTIDMITTMYKDDYAHCKKDKDNYCYYKLENGKWVNDNRLSQLTCDIQEGLKTKYTQNAIDLYREVSPYCSLFNPTIIEENNDFIQCLINLRDVANNISISKHIQNNVKKNNTLNLKLYKDDNNSKDIHKEYVNEPDDLAIFSSIFRDFFSGKREEIFEYIKNL